MSGAPKTYPYSSSEVTQKMDPQIFGMYYGHKNAPGRIALREASERARLYINSRKGDPAAQKEFYGYVPTLADLATKGTANPNGTTGYNMVFDPVSGRTRPVANAKSEEVAKAAQGGIVALKGYATGGKTKKQRLARPEADLPTELTAAEKKKRDQLNAIRNSTRNMTQAQIKKLNDLNAKQKGIDDRRAANPNTPANEARYKETDLDRVTPFWNNDPNSPGYMDTTNPEYLAARQKLYDMSALPEQYQVGTDFMKQAGQGLLNNANYTPERIQAERAAAAQMGPIGDVSSRDVSAERIASRDIEAERIAGGSMTQPKDVEAMKQQYFQLDPSMINHVSTGASLERFQMQGPGSWTDEGIADKYMNPYIQGVIDISKREKGRDYAKQVNQLNSQAVSAGAFGGARQALERAEASRNHQQQLQDLQTKGLSDAYMQGMNQWTGEAALGQQANIQNLQALLGVQGQESAQNLQAALANQGIDYQAAVQNLQAKLGVQESEAAKMLQASLANQQMGFGTAKANLDALMQTQLANQQAGMLAQTSNQNAALQAAMANQSTGLTAQTANQRAALEAALANQQTQYNVGAHNSSNQQQANLQNMLAQLQASQSNQQAGLSAQGLNNQAYSNAGSLGQGIGALGTAIDNRNMEVIRGLGAAGDMRQNMGQNFYNNLNYNAGNYLGGGLTNAQAGMGGAPPLTGGSQNTNTNQR